MLVPTQNVDHVELSVLYVASLTTGGLAAVIYTDTFQTVVMTIGAIILAVLGGNSSIVHPLLTLHDLQKRWINNMTCFVRRFSIIRSMAGDNKKWLYIHVLYMNCRLRFSSPLGPFRDVENENHHKPIGMWAWLKGLLYKNSIYYLCALLSHNTPKRPSVVLNHSKYCQKSKLVVSCK